MDTLTGRLGPREIALGVAFGVLLGLLPKANLLVVLLGILFFLSHANIVIGLAVTLFVSLAAPWIHPLCHRIGGDLLTSEAGQRLLGGLFRVPPIPWTMLDNTVVLGALVLGAALFVPIFLGLWIPLKVVWPKKKPDEENTE